VIGALLACAAVAGEPTAGRVAERIAARSDPLQTYALYLPSSYDASREWPALFLLDARGRALVPLERFRASAERLGFVLASSYNSASDGPVEVSVEALRAMWADARERLALDPRRLYLAGFSGTARTACYLALAAPGSVAAVIAAGAGFPEDQPPRPDAPLVFYGAVGDRDFNHDEMRALDDELSVLGFRHRIEVFPGDHEWPPEKNAAHALLWIEVVAMREGRRPVVPALVEELGTGDEARARAAEADGDLLEAHRLFTSLAQELEGLREVGDARRRAAAIEASPGYVRALQRERDRRREAGRDLERARRLLAEADPSEPAAMARTLAALHVAELKGRAARPDRPAEAAGAARLLNTLLVQTGFYLPREYAGRGEHLRAAFFLALAAEIAPEQPWRWVRLAAARVRAGQKASALAALERARSEGWSDATALEAEQAFAPLHGEERFRALVRALRGP